MFNKSNTYLKKEIAYFTINLINQNYNTKIELDSFIVNITKPEFEGNYTVVLFILSKKLNKNINELGQELGNLFINKYSIYFEKFNIIQGFLNLTIRNDFLINFLVSNYNNLNFGKKHNNGEKVMIEYSSPNTNKPLHLGHLRNNFLGYSIAKIYQWNGYDVFTSCIVNDRGIHICKSMLAWEKWGNGSTPEKENLKGDHFVGNYYVLFSKELKNELLKLKENGVKDEDLEKKSLLMQEIQNMLLKWENGDENVLNLWNKMNSWVYKGFEETYKIIGTKFNKIYYESETYLLGKKFVEQGLNDNHFYKNEDGSIWVDLENYGLDKKLLLRKDGTSVYITQDLGLAEFKYNDFNYNKSLYVVGDEQNYHFQVLKLILKKLNKKYSDGIFHLSYGMVELPNGKMKSREGTVVDADDLIKEIIQIAKQQTINLGKVDNFNQSELNQLYEDIGLSALKFYLLKVDPKKKIIFNTEESIDLQGFTGPFIQYTFARIQSILLKSNFEIINNECYENIENLEKDLLLEIELFTYNLEQSLIENNPSIIALYAFNLSKKFNSFYAQHNILQNENNNIINRRLQILSFLSIILKNCANILGFNLPNKM